MNERSPLLAARALTIGYPKTGKIVAQNLDLNLWPGQVMALLGPNGAGKSTLMRTLAGLQAPLAGTIQIAGKPLDRTTPVELARQLSLVLTERVETINLTVRELVALGRTPHTGWLGMLTPIDQQSIQAALEATGTLEYQDRRIQQLSDGERQKVMLARALAQDTAIILLDEPTAHLDLPSRVEMMHLLHRLARQTDKAILLSTHELDLALQAADQLGLMDSDGQLTTGVPEDLVLSGAFERTFARSGFRFDRTTGTFSMHEAANGPTLVLRGRSEAVFWTRRALLREGFTLSSADSPAGDVVGGVEVIEHETGTRWLIAHNGRRQEVDSIAALLAALPNWVTEG